MSKMFAIQPSKLALREQLARDIERSGIMPTIVAGFNRDTPALLNSPRKSVPEWEARKIQREKEKAKPKYIGQPEMMALLDLRKDGEGYTKLIRMIDKGKIPTPDKIKSLGNGKVTRSWLREAFEQFLKFGLIAVEIN